MAIPNAVRAEVRAALIHNPAAGHSAHRRYLARACAALQERGWLVRLEATTAPGTATALARAAAERGDHVAIVAGGDGTINEAIQGLAGTRTALGVLPVGTVNVWAREIGLPMDAVAAAHALVSGRRRTVDLGRVGERYFLLMAGAGFDGAVTALVEPELKRRFGRWAYAVTAVRLALHYGGADAVLEMDGATVRCRLLLVVVGNTRLYAGQFHLTGRAVADDGLLDVIVIPGRRPWEAIPRLLAIALRWPSAGRGALYYHTRRLRISSDETMPVQADGEYIGATPLEIAVAPAALRVIVPAGTRSPLFGVVSDE